MNLALSLATTAASAIRLRPGERPDWAELPGDEGAHDKLRAAARSARLPCDVVVALSLEFALIEQDLGAELFGIPSPATASHLAPSPELRQWIAQLDGLAEPGPDELPTVSLPARVLLRIPPVKRATLLEQAVDAPWLSAAIVLDRQAAIAGMTMESYAYRELALRR